jgi:hypothetical protein
MEQTNNISNFSTIISKKGAEESRWNQCQLNNLPPWGPGCYAVHSGINIYSFRRNMLPFFTLSRKAACFLETSVNLYKCTLFYIPRTIFFTSTPSEF